MIKKTVAKYAYYWQYPNQELILLSDIEVHNFEIRVSFCFASMHKILASSSNASDESMVILSIFAKDQR